MPKRSNIFPFLELATAPNGRQRRQCDAVGPIAGAQPDNQRAVTERHGVEMIDRFEEARGLPFDEFLDFLFHSVNNLLDFDFLFDVFSGQSTPVTLEA